MTMEDTMKVANTHGAGKVHIIDAAVERKDWQADVSECGRSFHAASEPAPGMAVEIEENLCETCRANAGKETLMPLYELADEAGN